MSKLEILNRKMLELEANGDISESEYATYLDDAISQAVHALALLA